MNAGLPSLEVPSWTMPHGLEQCFAGFITFGYLFTLCNLSFEQNVIWKANIRKTKGLPRLGWERALEPQPPGPILLGLTALRGP